MKMLVETGVALVGLHVNEAPWPLSNAFKAIGLSYDGQTIVPPHHSFLRTGYMVMEIRLTSVRIFDNLFGDILYSWELD